MSHQINSAYKRWIVRFTVETPFNQEPDKHELLVIANCPGLSGTQTQQIGTPTEI